MLEKVAGNMAAFGKQSYFRGFTIYGRQPSRSNCILGWCYLCNIMWYGESVAVLMMWFVYLVNAVIMFVKWSRESKEDASKEGEL